MFEYSQLQLSRFAWWDRSLLRSDLRSRILAWCGRQLPYLAWDLVRLIESDDSWAIHDTNDTPRFLLDPRGSSSWRRRRSAWLYQDCHRRAFRKADSSRACAFLAKRTACFHTCVMRIHRMLSMFPRGDYDLCMLRHPRFNMDQRYLRRYLNREWCTIAERCLSAMRMLQRSFLYDSDHAMISAEILDLDLGQTRFEQNRKNWNKIISLSRWVQRRHVRTRLILGCLFQFYTHWQNRLRTAREGQREREKLREGRGKGPAIVTLLKGHSFAMCWDVHSY